MKAGRALAVLLFAVLASTSNNLFAAGFGNDYQGCAYDRPCITEIYKTKAGGIFVRWNGQDSYSVYNVRWSRPGKDDIQVERGSGSNGSFHLERAHSGTTYTFKVQGCHKRPLQSSHCSPWEVQQFASK